MRGDVWAVIRREYLQRVRSKWFIAATAGAPIFMLALIVVPAYFASQGAQSDREIAIVDGTEVLYERLAPKLEEGGWTVSEERWRASVVTELREAAEEGSIGGFVILDELTLETGEAIFYTNDRPSTLRLLTMRTSISRSALEYQLVQQEVDAESLLSGGELRIELLEEDGADINEAAFAVAYVGAFLLYMMVLLYAVAVMRATLEEKTNRIVEVIISSMKPWHLMLGKILGVGAVSLTQMGIWVTAALLMFATGIPMLVAARPELANLSQLREILPGLGMLGLFIGYFVGGFFMYSGLYAAIGAMCNSDEEAQQAQWPVMMLLIIPIIMVTTVIEDPSSTMAVTLSLVPFFSPVLMWGRVAGGGVPVWQIGLSFVLMAVAVVAVAWLAGRIYKVGILMSGKRPTLPELVRWIREA